MGTREREQGGNTRQKADQLLQIYFPYRIAGAYQADDPTSANQVIHGWLVKDSISVPFDPVIPLLGIYLKKTKSLIQKDICTPMLIATLFAIAKKWKQPKCPSMDEWIKEDVVPIHNGILFSHNKERNPAICNMDGSRGYYAY